MATGVSWINEKNDASKNPIQGIIEIETKDLFMENNQFELVINGDGDIALKHSVENKTLLTMRFSGEVLNYLGENHVDVAKAMVEAGLRKVIDLQDQQSSIDKSPNIKTRQLH